MASLGMMSAGIAHEINNPLNFIKNGLEALDEKFKSKYSQEREELEPIFVIIYEGVKRTQNIVKSLGHFSRTNDEKKEECDLRLIIENCLLIMHNQIKDKVRVLTSFCDGGLVYGNEGKLHQAMLNILVNAVQAFQGFGTINVCTKTMNNELEITIQDDGVGIPAENLKKIKDPFFTTKPAGAGTGLGLFITYTIIEEHDGTIKVSSKEGKGTTFIVSLPRIV